jgi:hypothetical protein
MRAKIRFNSGKVESFLAAAGGHSNVIDFDDIRGTDLICQKWRLELLYIRNLTTMSNVAKESSSANDLLKNSTLYREFQAEREEILRHKWIESEKAGRDIGFEHALTDWIIKHRASWRKSRQAAAQN